CKSASAVDRKRVYGRCAFALIVHFFLLSNGVTINAQNFNLRNDPHGIHSQNSYAFSIEVNSVGDYVAIAAADFFDSLYFSSVVTAILIDPWGTVIFVDRVIDSVHATYPGSANGTDNLAGGGFVVGG